MKVLLVEDEPTIRETVADELEKWGFKVWTSTNFEHILNDFWHNLRNLFYLILIFLILMDFIGVEKFVKYRKYQLFSCHLVIILWIW